MEIFIDNNELLKLYTTGIGKYPKEIIIAFFKKKGILEKIFD